MPALTVTIRDFAAIDPKPWRVWVDGEERAKVRRSLTAAFEVETGRHVVSVRFWNMRSRDLLVDVPEQGCRLCVRPVPEPVRPAGAIYVEPTFAVEIER